MADIRVLLDDRPPADTYAAFQPIEGHVEVVVEKTTTCTKLVVKGQWHTHGRGNVATGDVEPTELFQGEWAPGQVYRYPFELHGLDGPLTYHGKELNLDWRIVAEADIPWAKDPKGQAEVVLVRGDARPDRLQQVHVPQVPQELTGQGLACVVPLVSAFFLLPGLGMMVGGALALGKGKLEGLFMIPFGLVFAGVASFILFLAVRNRIASSKLGEVVVQVTPERAAPGDEVRVRVSFRPVSDLQLNGITCKLVGQEKVVRGSGTDRKTHTHGLHEEQVDLREGGALRRMQDVALEKKLRIPAGAAPTLAVRDNELAWFVSVHIDIAGWPDWTRDVPVVVLPT